jgi:hypothetical protein
MGIIFGTVPVILGVFFNVFTVLTKSKTSVFRSLEGMLPIGFVIGYVAVCFQFTESAWSQASLVVFSMSPFYCLSASRLIIATVTKQHFSMLEDFHLSAPMVLGTGLLWANGQWGWGLSESGLMVGVLVGNSVTYFWFILHSIQQITESLGIFCLSIKKAKAGD